jgi:hypothetical protein
MNYKKLKDDIKPHLPYLFLIIIISFILYYPFLSSSNSWTGADWRLSHQNTLIIMHSALHNYHTLPLWTSLVDSGMPFFAIPDKPFLYPLTLFMLIFLGPVTVMNYSIILHLIIAGIFMYLLTFYLFKDQQTSFVSTILFMIANKISPPFWFYSTAYLPIIMLSLILIFKSKNWIKYSVITAILLTLQLLAGGIFISYYTFLFIIGPFFLYKLFISKNKLNIFVKISMIGLIIFFIFSGFAMIRFLPMNEWSNQINRAEGLSVQESMKTPLKFNNFLSTFVFGNDGTYQIGFVGSMFLILFFFYFYKTKDKQSFFFYIILILNILFASGLFYSFFWKYIPGLAQQRGITRSLFIFVFISSILVGYGFKFIKEKIISINKQKLFFLLIVLLIILDLLLFSSFKIRYPLTEPYRNVIDNNHLVKYLSEQEGKFRIKQHEVRGIDWNDMEVSLVPLGLEDISHGFGGFWFNEYLHGFMGLAYTDNYKNYAKILGILNVKYLTSSNQLNISNFEFINKFEEDPYAWPDASDGPYLYNNTKALPRAFISPHKVLVLGDYESALNLMRGVLLQNSFDTSKSIIVQGDTNLINRYNLDFLSKFDVILLTQGSIDQNSKNIIQSYIDKGGIILPNILEDKQSFNLEELDNIFSKFDQSIEEVKIKEYNQNSVVLDVSNINSDMLVMSERYSLFPEWKAYVDGKETKIYKTDVIISSIILPSGAKEVKFVYRPKSFVIGLGLFFITLILVLIYFGYVYFRSTKSK